MPACPEVHGRVSTTCSSSDTGAWPSLLTIAAAAVFAPAIASAAPNPSGSGQPSQSCGIDTAPNNPPGFDTAGFANAESHCAGSAPQNSKNPKSVSQYDVACYQFSQHH
jgi:hypothetical protein